MNDLENIIGQRLGLTINADVRKRTEVIENKEYILFYLSSLVNSELMVWLISSLNKVDFEHGINSFAVPIIEKEDNIDKIVDSVFNGNAALILPNQEVIICDVKNYPSRGISSPEVEKSVRGSKDSFTENLVDNIALIRRRIKSEKLIIKSYEISQKSKMAVNLLYLEDLVDKNALDFVEARLKRIDVESLVMSDRALEEAMFKQRYHIVPLVRYTERPDVASINLIRGKLILLVDTSCNALIMPISIFDHFKNVEEFKQNPLIGSFTKTLRLLGSLISVFLVPLFILFTIEDGYNNGIIPLYNLELTNPLLIEVSILTLVLEIIRIAVVHTPNAFTSALSLLAAIVLGDVALSIGLFSSEILLVTSLAVICNFATPSYELSLANRFISLIFIVATCIFKVKGFLICFILFFIYLSSIKILNVPYLYPICPFDSSMFKNLFIRKDNQKKK